MKWNIIDDLDNNILLYKGYDQKIPIRAWAVVVPNKKENKVKVLVSNDLDGLDTPGDFAQANNALVKEGIKKFSKQDCINKAK